MRRAVLALGLLAIFLASQPIGLFGGPLAAEGTEAQSAASTQAGEAEEDHGEATHEAGGHQSPVTPVLLALIIILAAAKIGGEIAERLSQPAVLGELIAGVFIGNLGLMFGYSGLEFLAQN